MERQTFYKYLWSAILTSLSGTLCVQIDGIIVSHLLGPNAFAAIGALMPVVQMQLTLCLLVGVGGALCLAYAVGAKDEEKKKHIFKTTITMLVLCSLPFVVASGWSRIVAGWFCHEASLMPYVTDYARVLLLSAPVYLLLQGSGAMVRAEGFPKRILYTMILANVLNLCMDVLFIQVFHWGIAGAGWATTISNLIALVLILLRPTQPYSSSPSSLDVKPTEDIMHILVAGAPIALASVAMFCRLAYLMSKTSTLLGAEGVVVLSFVLSVFLLVNLLVAGTTQALQPLAGQYIGQGNQPALYRTCRRALLFTIISSMMMTSLMIILAKPLCYLYGVTQHMSAAVPALRIFSLSCTFFSLVYVMMVIHQVVGNKVNAIILGVVQPLLLIPVFYVFTIPAIHKAQWTFTFANIQTIWWSFLIAESLNLIIVLILSRHVLKSVFTTPTCS